MTPSWSQGFGEQIGRGTRSEGRSNDDLWSSQLCLAGDYKEKKEVVKMAMLQRPSDETLEKCWSISCHPIGHEDSVPSTGKLIPVVEESLRLNQGSALERKNSDRD